MERNDLISKLCKEAAENTPDIYDKIIKAAKSEGLLGARGVGAPSTDGLKNSSSTAGSRSIKYSGKTAGAVAQNRFITVVAAVIAAITATLAVGIPLALNVNDGIKNGGQIEAPDVELPENPDKPDKPDVPNIPENPDKPDVPEVPENPDGVKLIEIKHKLGDGKYLWNEKDVLSGVYNLYGAEIEITRNNGEVSSVPLTVDLFENEVDFAVGNHEIEVTYGGKGATFSIFVASEDGLIEAVEGEYKVMGSFDKLIFDVNSPDGFDFGGLKIGGKFNLKQDGTDYFGYFGETSVNERFVRNFNKNSAGVQACKLVTGNINPSPTTIDEFCVMGYNSVKTEERVYLSSVYIVNNNDNSIVYHTEVSPERPYINVKNIPDRFYLYEPEYRAEFDYKVGDFTIYSGGNDEVISVDNIRPFLYENYESSGDDNLFSVLFEGERTVKFTSWQEEIEVKYATYNSDDTSIRFCRVIGDNILKYELSNGVTLNSIKQELIQRSLYVEYFEPVNGKYSEIVPITEDMIDFDGVDVNSYNNQYGFIKYGGKTIAVNIVKAYSVAGAEVLYNLKSNGKVNLILSETTFNDLGQCDKDYCNEIALYNNGIAMLKHTANGIGNVLTQYKLEGGRLTLIRHGFATSFLTVNLSNRTFDELDLKTVTAGMESKKYTFSHIYFPDAEIRIGWSGTFTAYTGETGFDYSWYVNVHLTGWASTANGGNSYQIAGVEYVAAWASGWFNNKKAFMLRFADKDWWFDIGTQDADGNYKLTLIEM